ncbi:hypothetical protein DL95DRAFT_313172, partial [Leptodontidium sp. 2 PMI_412]
CGVNFSIARIRGAHEPVDAAWAYCGLDYITRKSIFGGTSGCQSFQREENGDARGSLVGEHVASPGCYSTAGYCSHRLSTEEMSGCRTLQCLLKKDENWQAQDDDQDFKRTSNYFLTGISDRSPDQSPAMSLNPVRHGADEVWISNTSSDFFVSLLHVELRSKVLINLNSGR